jgi:hypothetical protein
MLLFSHFELLLLGAGSLSRVQFGKPDEGHHPLLGAAIKQRQ